MVKSVIQYIDPCCIMIGGKPSVYQSLVNQGFISPLFCTDERMEGQMKRWSEWAVVPLLQTGHSGKFPWDQSFFQGCVLLSKLPLFVCVCAHAWVRAVLWVSITFSQADISPHTKIKCEPWMVPRARECVLGACWVRADCQRFLQVSQVRWRVKSCWQRMYFLFILPGTRARPRHERRIKCTTVLLFCVKRMTLGGKMPFCEYISNNTNTCHQMAAGIQVLSWLVWYACVCLHNSWSPTMFNKVYFHFWSKHCDFLVAVLPDRKVTADKQCSCADRNVNATLLHHGDDFFPLHRSRFLSIAIIHHSTPHSFAVVSFFYLSEKYMEIGLKDFRGWQIAFPINAKTAKIYVSRVCEIMFS